MIPIRRRYRLCRVKVHPEMLQAVWYAALKIRIEERKIMNRRILFHRYLIVPILALCMTLPQVIFAQRDQFSSSTNSDQSKRTTGTPPSTMSAGIKAYITCDNEYVLYYGTATSATQFVGANSCYLSTGSNDPPNSGKAAGGTGCIANAQQYKSEIPSCDSYVYIAAKSDGSNYQGLLASFQIGTAMITSGDSRWKVYPTNTNLGASGSPSSAGFQAALNAKISSAVWSPVAVGNQNGVAGQYPVTATGFPTPNPHYWMWYESNNCPGPNSPFNPGCNHGEYLIFRLPLKDLCFNAQVNNSCCLGIDSQGHPIYAFSFQVNNPLSSPATVILTPPPGVAINSYGPQTIQPGSSSVVSGTFTWLNPGLPPKFCFIIQIAAKNGTKLSTEICFNPQCDK